MKSLKIFLTVLSLALFAAGSLIISTTLYNRAHPEQLIAAQRDVQPVEPQCIVMSNEEFANATLLAMDIKMPQGSGKLSAEELFKVKAGLLADVGINYFISADPNAAVLRGELCSVIAALNGTVSEAIEKSFGTDKPAIPYYDPIKGYILKTPPDLGDYAQQFGCVTGVLSEDTVCAKEIITALSNPVYATAVAEVYSKPEKQ